ncbi:hypothetical protein K438DRAFT_1772851 [Mycena galopus ATCC 62051]|nr:hypothetical protein K438DRAFT_1772851 [Mycena galopus ATCC 62051]
MPWSVAASSMCEAAPGPLGMSKKLEAITNTASIIRKHGGNAQSLIRSRPAKAETYSDNLPTNINFLALFLPTRNTVSRPWAVFYTSLFPSVSLTAFCGAAHRGICE